MIPEDVDAADHEPDHCEESEEPPEGLDAPDVHDESAVAQVALGPAVHGQQGQHSQQAVQDVQSSGHWKRKFL